VEIAGTVPGIRPRPLPPTNLQNKQYTKYVPAAPTKPQNTTITLAMYVKRKNVVRSRNHFAVETQQ
jgi:hypothetical protein